jgi:hypothetical protein
MAMIRGFAALAMLFVVAACGGGGSNRAAEIAFTVNVGGWDEIWLMRVRDGRRDARNGCLRHARGR